MKSINVKAKKVNFDKIENLEQLLNRAEKLGENFYKISCGKYKDYVFKILQNVKEEDKKGIEVKVNYCSFFGTSNKVFKI